MCTVTPAGSSSFGLLASRGFSSVGLAVGSLAVAASDPRDTQIHPSSPMNLMPLGSLSDTVMSTLPGYSSSM